MQVACACVCCPITLMESETRTDNVHKIIHSMVAAIQRDAESEVNLETQHLEVKLFRNFLRPTPLTNMALTT